MAKKTTSEKTIDNAPAEKPLLVLLDAHAIIHRAYHGVPDFSTSTGIPSGGLYGLVAMLVRIIEQLAPKSYCRVL
jgi:DNA polymerase-1